MPPAYQIITNQRYRISSGWETVETSLIREAAVTLTVNGKPWLSFACTPTDLDALAAGFLYNEGVIQSAGEIAILEVCKQGTSVDIWLHKPVERPLYWQRTSGCTGGLTSGHTMDRLAGLIPVTALDKPIEPAALLRCMDQLLQSQELYRETGGVHTSAISDGQAIRVRAEDIGRHNTFDKLAGRVLLDGIQVHPMIVVTTGRISSEMLQKSARLGAAAVVSRTSPTSQSVAMAEQMGIILVGYARRDGFLVYAHAGRLASIPAGAQAPLPEENPPDG